ncbi:MAG: hypothetical protein LBK43_03570, partial [Treponema sp.]|nr:hypothetical protein [Treponema sp.]
DFSTGNRTVLPHDFFDIAIDAGGNIIANSGSYGSGIWVYKTDSDDITADFSGQEDKVTGYTFKTGTKLYEHQSEVNPLGKLEMTASKVCLIKVQYKTSDTAVYFKVVFGMTMGQTQSYNMTVVPGLAAGETDKTEIKAAITGLSNGFGWLYFKLAGTGGPRVLNNGTTWLDGGTAVPTAANWDILATRTDELQSEDGGNTQSTQMPVASRSSVLLNTYKKVAAKVATGKLLNEVSDTDLNDTGLSGEIDAIGYGWYSMAGMPPTFSVAKNTYIIKTVEGQFVKFQPETFYGPKNESFVMDFSFAYKGSGTNPPANGEEEEEDETYSSATLNVDYAGANNAVFFDFSTGTVTELPHDFFDIAINAGGNIIANSGSYGSGVWVYNTGRDDLTADFSGQEDSVKEYTFKTGTPLYGYQTAENPLADLDTAASKVYLIKVQYTGTPAYFKVVFSMRMPGAGGYTGGPQYVATVVPGLAAGETNKTEIQAAITGLTNGYGWLYFKLVGTGGPRVLNNGTAWTGGGTAVPPATNWDILATRTNELQSTDGTTVSTQMPMASRSSVLLNTYKSVGAKLVTGKSIGEVPVTELSDAGLSGEIDTIGYGWYSMSGMPPTYSVPDNTYVIKTAEGGFAQFQPKTFSKDSKSFVMDFDYSYKSGE